MRVEQEKILHRFCRSPDLYKNQVDRIRHFGKVIQQSNSQGQEIAREAVLAAGGIVLRQTKPPLIAVVRFAQGQRMGSAQRQARRR
jgi:hypothetical protein